MIRMSLSLLRQVMVEILRWVTRLVILPWCPLRVSRRLDPVVVFLSIMTKWRFQHLDLVSNPPFRATSTTQNQELQW